MPEPQKEVRTTRRATARHQPKLPKAEPLDVGYWVSIFTSVILSFKRILLRQIVSALCISTSLRSPSQ